MHEPAKYYLSENGQQLLVDGAGGPYGHAVDLKDPDKPIAQRAAERELFAALQRERNSMPQDYVGCVHKFVEMIDQVRSTKLGDKLPDSLRVLVAAYHILQAWASREKGEDSPQLALLVQNYLLELNNQLAPWLNEKIPAFTAEDCDSPASLLEATKMHLTAEEIVQADDPNTPLRAMSQNQLTYIIARDNIPTPEGWVEVETEEGMLTEALASMIEEHRSDNSEDRIDELDELDAEALLEVMDNEELDLPTDKKIHEITPDFLRQYIRQQREQRQTEIELDHSDLDGLNRFQVFEIIKAEELAIGIPLPVGTTNEGLIERVIEEREKKADCARKGYAYPLSTTETPSSDAEAGSGASATGAE